MPYQISNCASCITGKLRISELVICSNLTYIRYMNAIDWPGPKQG